MIEGQEIKPALRSPAQYLEKPITHLAVDYKGPAYNSDYKGPDVPLSEIKIWENFLECNESNDIREFLDRNPVVDAALKDGFTQEQLDMFTWGAPKQGKNNCEQSFERLWAHITSALNLIHEVCASAEQGTENPISIVIGDGGCARRKAPEAICTHNKKPDFAGYREGYNNYDGEDLSDPYTVANRIPGDAKIAPKIRRSMFPPDGEEYETSPQWEVQKVINQIYDYMDQHEARYGYIVNDQELIMFRRRSTSWGHVDISPAIRHDKPADLENNIFNSKYVLFYFHYVVANEECLWRMSSCRNSIKRRKTHHRRSNIKKRR
jgi:hypothetical protein